MKKTKFPENAELLTIEEASARLGKGYSRRSITRRIDSGEWQEGFHWMDCRREGAIKRLIKINITAVLNTLVIPAAKR